MLTDLYGGKAVEVRSRFADKPRGIAKLSTAGPEFTYYRYRVQHIE